MGKKPGRKAFKGLAPKGYRIRMMEPGEAEALLAIRREGASEPAAPTCLADFVRFLLSHEIFVAVDKRDGHPVGFAAARSRGEVYWLAEHRVLTPHRACGIGRALLAAVTQRARWFALLAVGIPATIDITRNAALNESDGFVAVPCQEVGDRLTHRKAIGTAKMGDLDTRMVWIKRL